MGRIHVDGTTASQWILATENVRRFSLINDARRTASSLVIDGEQFAIQNEPNHYCRLETRWKICSDTTWPNLERSPPTYGPIFQIYESPILIIAGTQGNLLLFSTFWILIELSFESCLLI